MAIVLAATALCLSGVASEATAQTRGNAQADQSRRLLNRGGAPSPALPAVGRYVSESGEGFTLDRSGRYPLLRFDRRDETWVLRATPAPRGDVIYRNDAGDQVLRVTPNGGLTVFSSRAPGGSPASFSGSAAGLALPTLGPAQLFQLITRRSFMVSQAVGRLIYFNVDTDIQSEGLTVEALIVSTDVLLRIARSPTARSALSNLRSVTISEGARSSVDYRNGVLTITVAPSQGAAGRPSSARIIRTLTSPS